MGAFPTPPDEGGTLELIGRIQEGEREAWNELYNRYHDQLLFAVRARLGVKLRRHLQSEDVFQSVAIEAFKALETFEYRGAGSLHRFLKTLVMNKIRDRADTFGAQKRSGEVALSESMVEALSDRSTARDLSYLDAQRYEQLERCMESLPEEMREVLLLRKVDGFSSKEVAEALGKSDSAVRKVYSRALARLTALMMEGPR